MTPTASEVGPTVAGEAYSRLARMMLMEARDEVSRADAKANVLVALFAALQVVFLTALTTGAWTPDRLHGLTGPAFWIGWLLSVGGLVAIGLCVYPRTANRHNECINYFSQVARCETIGEMRAGLERAVVGLVSRDEEQLWTVSRIVRSKYQYIQWSMWLTVLGVLLCAIAVFVGR